MKLFVALVHYPVVDRRGDIVTSSVTNLDLHDIARSCRTFGVTRYFVVHPSQEEHALSRRIVRHWESNLGERFHPTRKEALGGIELCYDFDEVLASVKSHTDLDPVVVGTSASATKLDCIDEADLCSKYSDRAVVLVFGTAYGLAPHWLSRLECFLGPISGSSEYNHLSVRSAVAIYLDRILRAQLAQNCSSPMEGGRIRV